MRTIGSLLLGLASLASIARSAEPTQGLETALRSIVVIEATGMPGGVSSFATGVIIDSLGGIVTALHAVDGADEIRIGAHLEAPRRVVLSASDRSADLALLDAIASDRPAPPLPPAAPTELGAPIFVIGNALGTGVVVTHGIVAALPDTAAEQGSPEGHLLVDALVAQGSSGGPAVDREGRWVGLVVGKAVVDESVVDLGMVIPTDRVLAVVRALRARQTEPTPWIGIDVETMTAAMAAALSASPGLGVVVSRVVSGGPGNRAGLAPIDVITAVDGRPVHSAEEFERAIASRRPGEALKLSISTDGHGRILQVELREAPPEPEDEPAEVVLTELKGLGLTVAQLGGSGAPVVVVSIVDGGPGDRAEIRLGDRIDLVGRRPAGGSVLRAEVQRQLSGSRAVLLRIHRGDLVRLVAVDLM
ncbi:MAG: hypothetical protein CME06_14945 [Gemmatimonadetes bacterium]|nr:hypothetical protein [Gemmatimonadota bacterium]